jgi:hypothetical protein
MIGPDTLPTLPDDQHVLVRIQGEWFRYRSDDAARPVPSAVFPGAFNPLHIGHRHMAEVADSLLGVPVQFELSAVNVDKPPLGRDEIVRRATQFAARRTVWVTAAPTFMLKARLFPGATFVIGVDTLIRIADPKYYRNSEPLRDEAVTEIARRGGRFLVFGRLTAGHFLSASDLVLPEELRRLCQSVPESQFREDVSSTDLRRESEGP